MTQTLWSENSKLFIVLESVSVIEGTTFGTMVIFAIYVIETCEKRIINKIRPTYHEKNA